jgi:hypothetical protein
MYGFGIVVFMIMVGAFILFSLFCIINEGENKAIAIAMLVVGILPVLIYIALTLWG